MQPPVCIDQSPERVAARMRQALDLHRSGVRMMRARLEHDHPEDSRQSIRDRLNRWLQAPSPQQATQQQF